jgi:polysaccharide biosynthesis protein PslH
MEKPSADLVPKLAAVLVAPEAPFPVVGGGALHTAGLLTYLARNYDLDVIVFREPGTADPAAAFPAGLVRSVGVIDLPRHSKSTAARVMRNLRRLVRGTPPLNDRFTGFGEPMARLLGGRRYDLGIVEHFWCAAYGEQLSTCCRTTVLDLLDVESTLYRRYARSEPWPLAWMFHRFHQSCLALERRWLPRYSFLLATSEDDAARLRELAPGVRAEVYPNTIPAAPLPRKGKEDDAIIFAGNLEYQPNVSAVRFFRSRIWPLLRERWPGLVWRLVGKNPQGVARCTAGDSRIEVVGPVSDAVQALASAKVAVVPLVAGSGTRVKILEAWAAGTPVVSTSLGAEGLMCRSGEHLLVADQPELFAEAVSNLLASRELRMRLARAGRLHLDSHYTWDAGWRKLRQIGI